MAAKKTSSGLEIDNVFYQSLDRLSKFLEPLPDNPKSMPVPLMVGRLIHSYQYGAGFPGIQNDSAMSSQVIKAHRLAYKATQLLLQPTAVQGEPLVQTLVEGIRRSQNKPLKLANLALLHIFTFPLYFLYSLYPEYMHAGQLVKGRRMSGYRQYGKRRSRETEVKDYPKKWVPDYGTRAFRMGKPGLVLSMNFFRWFSRLMKKANLRSHDEYTRFLSQPKYEKEMMSIASMTLQLLSVSRLRPRGGSQAPTKKWSSMRNM